MEVQNTIHKYLATNTAFFQLFVGQQIQSAHSLSNTILSYWIYIGRTEPSMFSSQRYLPISMGIRVGGVSKHLK